MDLGAFRNTFEERNPRAYKIGSDNIDVAFVLPGGGALGAFQAEMIISIMKGFNFDISVVSGVSVGALNGAMLATRRLDRLHQIWSTITEAEVFTRRPIARVVKNFAMHKLGFGTPYLGAYDHSPLLELIQKEINMVDLINGTPFLSGRVSLRTGEYYNHLTNQVHKEILASATIPIVWSPVCMPPDNSPYVDGGVRNIAPLGDVLDYDPELVIMIPCGSVSGDAGMADDPKDILDVAMRTVGIMTNETLKMDVKMFRRLNDLVWQARREGIELRKGNGDVIKPYELVICEPTESLGDSLDFSRPALTQRRAHAHNVYHRVYRKELQEAVSRLRQSDK